MGRIECEQYVADDSTHVTIGFLGLPRDVIHEIAKLAGDNVALASTCKDLHEWSRPFVRCPTESELDAYARTLVGIQYATDAKLLPWSIDTTARVARIGSLEALRWLRSKYARGAMYGACPWDASAVRVAVKRGDMAMLAYMRDARRTDGVSDVCPWDETVSEAAALYDATEDFKMLRWMRDESVHGEWCVCPWDERCMHAAISRGARLEFLQWMRDAAAQGGMHKVCPIIPDSVYVARSAGREDVVAWLLAQIGQMTMAKIEGWIQRAPRDESPYAVDNVLESVRRGDFERIRAIATSQVDAVRWAAPHICTACILRGDRSAISWCLTHYPTESRHDDVWCAAIEAGDGLTFVRLYTSGPLPHESYAPRMLAYAARNANTCALRWLRTHYPRMEPDDAVVWDVLISGDGASRKVFEELYGPIASRVPSVPSTMAHFRYVSAANLDDIPKEWSVSIFTVEVATRCATAGLYVHVAWILRRCPAGTFALPDLRQIAYIAKGHVDPFAIYART